MKKVFLIAYISLTVFISSCNKTVPLYNSEQFKSESYKFEIPTYNMLWTQLVGDKLYFVYRNKERPLICYDMKTHNVDTLVKRNEIIDICALNDSCIFYTDFFAGKYEYHIEKIGAGNFDYFKDVHKTVKHPYWENDYTCMSVYGLPLIMINENTGIIHCSELYCFADDYSILIKKNIPVWLRFEIAADSTIKPVSFFGTYPKNHPIENYYNGGQLYCFYNSQDRNILNHTCIDNYVVLCDPLGNKIKDVYFGSNKFHYAPFPKSDKNSMNASDNYYLNNTTYHQTISYDEYRNLYFRVLHLPRLPDKEAMTRENIMDFLLIVADSNLKIKYEVFFDGKKYFLPFGKFLINEKGVMIYEKDNGDNKNSRNASWFVFD